MPWIDNARDWPHAMSTWDAARHARHAAHAARFVVAGWRAETASILSFDLVLEEDEAKASETPKTMTRVKKGSGERCASG